MKSAQVGILENRSEEYDFVSLLQERFDAARRRNARFSLRSYARKLGLDHSTLSQILRGKRRLTCRIAESVGKRLGLSAEAMQLYIEIVRNRPFSKRAPGSVKSLQFNLDTFQLLSVWYHRALLELTHIQEFRPDSRWIAKALGISAADVNIALQRVLRLKLLEMCGPDRWLDKSGDAEFRSTALTEGASNRINQEVYELATQAVERIPGTYRVHSNTIVALDSRELPRLSMLADEFMREVRSLASKKQTKDDVYQVELSAFPLTTLKEEGDE